MAAVLRIKIVIGVVALIVLTAYTIFATNFFATATLTRWTKLSQDNFQGIPQPSGSFGAAIHSQVYLEYDSAHSRYVAYAAQNNMRSWTKPGVLDDEYALGHEQYHFNITELHARKLNAYIEKHPEKSDDHIKGRLKVINADLNVMQTRYDDETDHSLVFDKQRRWEYTIDSLMTLERGWVTDKFSGARAYFPLPPDSSTGVVQDMPYRMFELEKYGVYIQMISYQETPEQYRKTIETVIEASNSSGVRSKTLSTDPPWTFRAFTIEMDSDRISQHTLWIGDGKYVCRARVRFSNDTRDTTGYAKIASSFLNSVSVVNTNEYWINKSITNEKHASELETACNESKSPDQLILLPQPQTVVFFRGPFYRDDGTLLLACDYLYHRDTHRLEDIIQTHNEKIHYCPAPEGQVYAIHRDHIPNKPFNVHVGYLAREDSTKLYYEFFHQRIEITPGLK